jgi:hypothetical protein
MIDFAAYMQEMSDWLELDVEWIEDDRNKSC